MNRRAILTAAAMCVLCILPPLASCGVREAEQNASSLWSYFEEAPIDGGVLVKAEEGQARIRWAAHENAERYIVYRSPSRFGTYEKEGTLSKDVLSYSTEEDVYDCFKVCAVVDGEEVMLGEPSSAFSPNSLVVKQTDDMDAVQREIDAIHAELETGASGQFSSRRAAFLFQAGSYPLITAKAGYYTSVHGLGETPEQVHLGGLYVSDKVLSNRNATCTFWRSAENLTVDSSVTWAVSQATSLRRMNIEGDLALSYPPGYSSGGFLANSAIGGKVISGTQQQWLARNSSWTSFTGGSFNMVYMGCEGETHENSWSDGGGFHTNFEQTEKIAEKPFLFRDGSGYSVFVPAVREDTRGVTWEAGIDAEGGDFLSLDTFYIADARYDDDVSLNAALNAGRSILFTPGIYTLDRPLSVEKEGTVLLGLGYATLKISDANREGALRVADVGGVRIADLLLDAGAYSENMAVIGTEKSGLSHAEDPAVLSDFYIRVGGAADAHTETGTALVVNSNDVIGDNFWIWRADHTLGVAWQDERDESGEITNYGNPAVTGVEVRGDRVRCYALMVEHFEGYQTVWKGEDGLTVMYQSETPYRIPSQDDWMSPNGKKGCASYKVSDAVTRHRGYCIGIYLVNFTGQTLDSAVEAPEKSGIDLRRLTVCNLSGNSAASRIMHVLNDFGGGCGGGTFRSFLESAPW